MSASKSWLQNEWDTNKQTLLDPDKGLYELTHAKKAVSAARDVAVSVDEGAGKLLAALELACKRLEFLTNWIENSYGGSNSDVELGRSYQRAAQKAIDAHKARLTTSAPIAQLWENDRD